MAVFATAEDGAEDDTAHDFHIGVLSVGPFVERCTRVALAAAEDVTVQGVTCDFIHGLRHADGTSRHLDGTFLHDVGDFACSKDRGQDVTPCDFHVGVAVHTSCRATPLARRVGIVARATAKHVAKEGVAVGSAQGTTLGIVFRMFFRISEDIIRQVLTIIAERPSVALVEACNKGVDIAGIRVLCLDGINDISPLGFLVHAVPSASRLIISVTDLAARNQHFSVAQHQAVFAAAIHRGIDEGLVIHI